MRRGRKVVVWVLVILLCMVPAALMARWWAARSEQHMQAHLQQLAKAPITAGDHDPALEELQRLARERGWDPRVFYWLGARLTAMGRHNEAVQALARSSALNPRSAAARAALGVAMARADHPEDGEIQLKQAIALDPRLEFAHFALGSIYAQYSMWDLAIHELRTAGDLNPNDLEAQYLLATVYEHVYLEDRKLDILERLVKRSPNDIRFLKSLGYVYLYFGKFAEGEALYRRVLKLAPDDQEAHYLLGRALAEQANTPDQYFVAEKELKDVEAKAPDQPGVHTALGILYFRRNDPTKAIVEFERAVKAGSTEQKVLLNLGLSYMRAGRTEDGKKTLAEFNKEAQITRDISQYENRLFSMPEDTAENRREKDDVRMRLIRVYMTNRQYQQALSHLRTLLKSQPDNREAAKLAAECQAHLTPARAAQAGRPGG